MKIRTVATTSPLRRKMWVAGALVTAAATLAACGSDSGSDGSTPASSSSNSFNNIENTATESGFTCLNAKDPIVEKEGLYCSKTDNGVVQFSYFNKDNFSSGTEAAEAYVQKMTDANSVPGQEDNSSEALLRYGVRPLDGDGAGYCHDQSPENQEGPDACDELGDKMDFTVGRLEGGKSPAQYMNDYQAQLEEQQATEMEENNAPKE